MAPPLRLVKDGEDAKANGEKKGNGKKLVRKIDPILDSYTREGLFGHKPGEIVSEKDVPASEERNAAENDYKRQEIIGIMGHKYDAVIGGAVKAQNIEMLRKFLGNENKENINKRDDNGKTAIVHALETGNNEILKMLLDAGADVTKSDFRNMPIEDYAHILMNPEAVAMLKEGRFKSIIQEMKQDYVTRLGELRGISNYITESLVGMCAGLVVTLVVLMAGLAAEGLITGKSILPSNIFGIVAVCTSVGVVAGMSWGIWNKMHLKKDVKVRDKVIDAIEKGNNPKDEHIRDLSPSDCYRFIKCTNELVEMGNAQAKYVTDNWDRLHKK